MMHDSLFVFDIETIPDTDAAHNLTGTTTTDVASLRQEMEQYHLDITDGRNSFLRQPFHKVVAISFLIADIHRDGGHEYYALRELRSGGTKDSSEEELVKGFFQYLSKHLPRLVSFNGRTFDMPVMKYRAMVHHVSAPRLYDAGDKWNSYTQRYSLDWHCDLLEGLSDFGASARLRLNEACSVMGFPGKFGVDGSKVTDMYDAGEIGAIRDYCETDVLNTYLVYLRYMHHLGRITTEGYDQAIGDILKLIETEGEVRPYLREFHEAWEDANGGAFFMAPQSPSPVHSPEKAIDSV
jgi:predicted PolB exonuclease-like 3'-5' exonuclease